MFDARKHGAFIRFNAIGLSFARGCLGIIYVRKSPEFRLRFFHFWPAFWYYFPLCTAPSEINAN
jgi:hypothetical protein